MLAMFGEAASGSSLTLCCNGYPAWRSMIESCIIPTDAVMLALLTQQ